MGRKTGETDERKCEWWRRREASDPEGQTGGKRVKSSAKKTSKQIENCWKVKLEKERKRKKRKEAKGKYKATTKNEKRKTKNKRSSLEQKQQIMNHKYNK